MTLLAERVYFIFVPTLMRSRSLSPSNVFKYYSGEQKVPLQRLRDSKIPRTSCEEIIVLISGWCALGEINKVVGWEIQIAA